MSPNSKLALSSGCDLYTEGGDSCDLSFVKLWDLASGYELRSFAGRAFYKLAFSPDSTQALAADYSGAYPESSLKLWDLASGREPRSFNGLRQVASLAFSPDGKLVMASGEMGVRLWEVASGRQLLSFASVGTVTSIDFSPDGKLLLLGSSSEIKLLELASGGGLYRIDGHFGPVIFSPDGKLLLASGDKGLSLRKADSGRELSGFIGPGTVSSLHFSPDGRLAVASGKMGAMFWEVASGRELRRFTSAGTIYSLQFSRDGKLVAASGEEGVRLWEVASGRELRRFDRDWGEVFTFSADGRLALRNDNSGRSLILWDLSSDRQLSNMRPRANLVTQVAYSPDGTLAVSIRTDATFDIWELASGRKLRSFSLGSDKKDGPADRFMPVAISADSKAALSGSCAVHNESGCVQGSLKLWDIASGDLLQSFTAHQGEVRSVAISFDGKLALSAGCDQFKMGTCEQNSVKLWDLTSGREVRSFEQDRVQSVTFSPDGKLALSVGGGITGTDSDVVKVKLWEVASGREVRNLVGGIAGLDLGTYTFSPNGKLVLSGNSINPLKIWDVTTGRELRSFAGRGESNHEGRLNPFAFSSEGELVLALDEHDTPKLWDTATGRVVRRLTGHTDLIGSAAFSPGGTNILTGSDDGTVRLWDVETGKERAAFVGSPPGEQIAITPDGFFFSSTRDTNMLAVVRGLEASTVGQVHQSLYNPDLVREALAGDPNGEVKRAAEVINLEKVLDSGPAPEVEIASHEQGSGSNSDLAGVTARIKDNGKGIGRIEWRVNGITVAVRITPKGAGPVYEVKQEVALDPGNNEIEVVAYNASNLLASLPAKATIAYVGRADALKPKLHVLAIGINNYTDQGGIAPGRTKVELFPPLKHSADDAKALGAELEKAGAGLYGEVRVRTALDEDATAAKLDAIVMEMAAGIHPRDTFVLFAAAHGFSHEGRFYLIPQDYQGGPDPKALASRAIGQDKLQDWIANRIKAKKALILLDTCESGALTGGYMRSRINASASEAGIGRLHEATGRPVLTAAGEGKSAREDYKGHGVFTYAAMEALHKGDTNGNGKIELTELAAYVEKRVPELFAELKDNGWVVKGVTPTVTRGSGDDMQTAHFGTTGGDFAVVARLP